MASFIKIKLSELYVNAKGQLVTPEDNKFAIDHTAEGANIDPDEFCFNMLTEVENIGVCFGFSPRYIDRELGW